MTVQNADDAYSWDTILDPATWTPEQRARYERNKDREQPICAYCGVAIDFDHEAIVPDADDDEGWAALTHDHTAFCEWFVTRAHRLAQ